jgi:hypothetical protein
VPAFQLHKNPFDLARKQNGDLAENHGGGEGQAKESQGSAAVTLAFIGVDHCLAPLSGPVIAV